ncbi:hypothetical protein AGABI1DRAFT_81570 [Agaricus bisporus var. burnettii JB137-S8]|uniref:Uncharacterized protein n=1 Tax=Agaricus bisporus var. burnettii (strain JB137-S8 / ATCC MYA-4627 / FGSC 10392) TaxID=597362 RepID=K5Y6N5_AGABU|nr:hypothetical protein AGABI2DRAFT_133076 [Agaricus bisporus var. bisporus H97]XP_007325276.1 uncharacterized protein AGABI1DRAFT_81570 [Agaricus bisporus var. burnettii JB137-S8]EKM83845.1 hypothetical protein AGABI1DRAFT_81570 [Agaricus bisporus var. burnettii JB137-S8]EKV51394.1 hypothetical protein AGABI2DRAFT_133076 [Agaricus bisporus var. bisporus H97]
MVGYTCLVNDDGGDSEYFCLFSGGSPSGVSRFGECLICVGSNLRGPGSGGYG